MRSFPRLVISFAAILCAAQAQAEYRTYGTVSLNGLVTDGPNANAAFSTAMVCSVNGPDGFLTIRSGPGTNYRSNRKLNRLATLTIDPSQRRGSWIPVRTAVRTHSKAGRPLGYEKSLHVTGWAHRNYICDYRTENPQLTSLQVAPAASQPVQQIIIQQSPEVSQQVAAANQAAAAAKADSASSKAEVSRLQRELDSLSTELAALREMQKQQAAKAVNDPTPVNKAKAAAVTERVSRIEGAAGKISDLSSSRYDTPIRPSNPDLGNTARKLSELFPKVPYYEVGTRQTGEMWIRPTVTDQGEQLFRFSFLDPASNVDEIVETISLDVGQLALLSSGLSKTHQWAEVARRNKVGRFQKTAICVTENQCEDKVNGKSSTAVQFRVYEDRSSGAQIVRNKGRFSIEFGFSIESALLLSSYADYIIQKATEEFEAGSRSDQEIDALFD